MLDVTGLKAWIHGDFSNKDKLFFILATFDRPAKIAELRERASEAGFKIPKKSNISAALARSGGRAIRVPEGWELTEAGKAHLRNLGVDTINPAAAHVAADLRAHLDNVKDPVNRSFLEEAIKCHEAKLFRSAVVMSWMACVGILYSVVVRNHLQEFNSEARRRNPKWKNAVNEDGISQMRESDFLDVIAAIGIIGKNVKDELAQALKLRNGCGHPNSLKIGSNKVNSHIATLILNVFEKFN